MFLRYKINVFIITSQCRILSYRDYIFFFYFNETSIIIKCVCDHIEKFNKFQDVGKLQITIFKYNQSITKQ